MRYLALNEANNRLAGITVVVFAGQNRVTAAHCVLFAGGYAFLVAKFVSNWGDEETDKRCCLGASLDWSIRNHWLDLRNVLTNQALTSRSIVFP
jgi:hypothetical protein